MVKDLYTEYYKTLLKDIEEKNRKILCHHELEELKFSYLLKQLQV